MDNYASEKYSEVYTSQTLDMRELYREKTSANKR
jgi:hypothetical protein